MEIWKTIENFENYSISSHGRVRNKKHKILSNSHNVRNFTTYARVTLFLGGVRNYRQVHRLVASAFIPNPHNLPQVDHVDGNGLNNHVSNLRWVTASENIHSSFAKNPEMKKNICSRGGKKSGAIQRNKALQRLQNMLGRRFITFYGNGEIFRDACVTYACECGVVRTASIQWKEIRNHSGKCPECTNTVNRSSESIL